MTAAIATCTPSATAALQAWRPRTAAAAASRRSCRRRGLPAHAGLLGLFGSGSSTPQLANDEEGEALRAWLEQRGLPPQQLAAVVVPGAGRGLAATKPIAKGEALLRLPLELVLTPAAAQQRSCLRPLLEEAEAAGRPLPAWSVLALFLAEAHAAGATGDWWPYLRLLPEQTGCVLEWSEAEVGWLRGSQLHEAALEIRAAADASWQEMQPLLAAAAQRGLAPPGAFDRASLQSAFAMLLSRLVRLASLGGNSGSSSRGSGSGSGSGSSSSSGGSGPAEPPGTEALLPFADLLNHGPSCTSHLDWSAQDAAVVLRADRKYKAGEEVLVSYGDKTGGELLLSYGFAPPPATNPHDGVKLRLSLRQDDPVRDWKAAALARHGFAPSQLFPLRMQAAPWELMHYAGMCVAEVGSAADADSLAERLFRQDDFPRELQPVALEAVIRACQAAQQAYPSSLDADRAELEALQQQQQAGGGSGSGSSGAAPSRRQQVLQVLIYERQVLARTIFILQQELRDVKRLART
ncbi:ribulose-1,5 bisphosphate carboxylase oxygenase large subunit N- chloroplastic [Chlorella sorokiniana]|uniref:Ribulose-1,5 bisphosphate carboxylase oxygenase large subunit N-chloroplastic n=1 Tax=Chlorella sorokiniana TaxID=3076 RepID=A0A2P6TRZ2_CHLSO|nr:ribulose-1,5 bisphosphate carboxylase oxygenase large subunit N- chloroplastic [Chlorella sorokiniana]|eukprot:PRW56824.1 ribulose-1,5 bisphosphate carboxylase oxygenase large subunit N- chloroplastic [Chlorella sorokiniana]